MLVPTIIAYDIVSYSEKGDTIRAVNNAIKQGWQPLGPVVKYRNSGYYQTMVKYKQPKSNSI